MTKIIIITCILLLTSINLSAQKSETKTVKLKVKSIELTADSIAKPKIYVDGKLFEFDVELIDQDKIESMTVFKGEKAIKDYNAPEGVILIKTKFKTDTTNSTLIVSSKTSKIQEKTDSLIIMVQEKTDPLFIIDGKVEDKNKIKDLSPDDIESISVLKDKAAKTLYNSENGVIIIKTKKEKD